LGFTVAEEGKEAGDLGGGFELAKEKRSLKEEKTFAGANGPWALNQVWQDELGQLLGSRAEKEEYRM
jgi:hypothetical protein